MAGTRHHHVWQMLQRGFSWQEFGDDQVWVYSKEDGPKRTVTRKFGREKFFYGEENSPADVNITNFENEISGFVHTARNAAQGEVLDAKNAGALLAHLEMRSLFLRSEMSNLVGRLFQLFHDYMASPKYLRKILLSYLRNHPDQMDKIIEESVPAENRVGMREILGLLIPQILDEGTGDIAEKFSYLISGISARVPDMARDAHNKALGLDFSEVERAELHGGMDYRVLRDAEARFILPDTCAVFFLKTGCSPFSQKDNRIEGVAIPISADVAIWGSRAKNFSRDIDAIVSASASCAYEAFLSNRVDARLKSLSKKIGTNAKLVGEAEFKRMLTFEELLKL